MVINEISGNLFDVDIKYSLVQCVSYDVNDYRSWGLGIAALFKRYFPQMKSYCADVIRNNDLKYPCTIPYRTRERYVFNLITKEKYWLKPTYYTLEYCIREMAMYCKRFNIKYLAMPLIGCGLDKLQWYRVKNIIEMYFNKLDIEILIVKYKK